MQNDQIGFSPGTRHLGFGVCNRQGYSDWLTSFVSGQSPRISRCQAIKRITICHAAEELSLHAHHLVSRCPCFFSPCLLLAVVVDVGIFMGIRANPTYCLAS